MLSIIIPVLNEAETITKLLTHLTDNSTSKNISEIIVVDGGSTDDTLTSVTQFSIPPSDKDLPSTLALPLVQAPLISLMLLTG